jgi:hypothetical protein
MNATISRKARLLAQEFAHALGPECTERVQLVIHHGVLRQIQIVRFEPFTIEPKETE